MLKLPFIAGIAGLLLSQVAAADMVSGTAGPDFLVGKPGSSTVAGGAGADWIAGEPLTGDGGALRVDRLTAGIGPDGQTLPQPMGRDSRYWYQAFSRDGRYMVFSSAEKDLIPGLNFNSESEAVPQIYLKDLSTGRVRILSVDANGAPISTGSNDPAISPDGRFVAYTTDILTAGGKVAQIAVRSVGHPNAGQVIISRGRGTGELGNLPSYEPFFSPDSRRLVFSSDAKNLVIGDTDDKIDVFVVNLGDNPDDGDFETIGIASTKADGGITSTGGMAIARFSPDGSYIVFTSNEVDVLGSAVGQTSVQLLRKQLPLEPSSAGRYSGLVTRVTERQDGSAPDQLNAVEYTISPDGRRIAFSTQASMEPADTNGVLDIYVKTVSDPNPANVGRLERVTAVQRGLAIDQGDADSDYPVFSPDGTRIAFATKASLFVGKDAAGSFQVVTRSLVNGRFDLISSLADGSVLCNSDCLRPIFSPDGRSIVFKSQAGSMTSEVVNGSWNIYRAILPAPPGGADTIDGGSGADVMAGGPGDDSYRVDAAADTVIESPSSGTDRVTSTVSYRLPAFVENLTLAGSAALGGAGNEAANTLAGNAAANGLKGGAGNDLLLGGDGSDTLAGEAGNDRLVGGRGRDVLYGGPGADRFVYRRLSDSPAGGTRRDVIRDFRPSEGDKIDLSAIDANPRRSGNQAFEFIGSGAFQGRRGQLRYASGVLSADVNGDRKAEFQIRLPSSVTVRVSHIVR